MIKINETYSINPYQFGWELHETTINEETKKGFTVNVTYHPNLSMICGAVIDKSAKGCESMENMLVVLVRVRNDLDAMIKEIGRV